MALAPPRSLEEIHSSVPVPSRGWRRALAFAGPAFLVSVGYMDPGNWGTDIQAGSAFGYRLLWVLLMSNLMAMLLQSLASRLGIVTGRDLAQACRETYPRSLCYVLWVLAEVAIAATDLAEVIGTVIALKLLFGLSYFWGLLIAAGDTFLLLALQKRGVRALELVTLGLIAIVGGSFFIELFLFRPDWGGVASGLVPTFDPVNPTKSVYVAIAMLGATVMPHNLYLHSALVQTRDYAATEQGRQQACKYNLIDSVVALNGAFFINAAILVLSATTFFAAGKEVESLSEAHRLLGGLWSFALASTLFAVALLASGQSSTLTGTLAGQIVMEGFLHLRLRPWLRRLVTRCLAILPALLVLTFASREQVPTVAQDTVATRTEIVSASPKVADKVDADGKSPDDGSLVDRRLLQLLVLSQAILSFQLPFAIMPLVRFTDDRRRMGKFANGTWLKGLAWICAAVVVGLNGVMIYLQTQEWAESLAGAGWSVWWLYGTIGPLTLLLAGFLVWVTVYPSSKKPDERAVATPAPVLPAVRYHHIGVAVEFEGGDDTVLTQAAALARAHDAELVILHVVEGLGASYHGPATHDRESVSDRVRMDQLVQHLREDGLSADGALGYGEPAEELVRIARDRGLDLLVLGTHGHGFFADMALGRTVSPVLHRLTIPVLVVPTRTRVGPSDE
jgi:manganese transport protein